MSTPRHPGTLRVLATTVALTFLLAGAASCTEDAASRPDPSSGTDALDDDAITIGAFNFDESTVLAELYGQALQAQGFTVHIVQDVGPRELLFPALELGLVEFVPEYSGAALDYVSGAGSASDRREVTESRLRDQLRPLGLEALDPAPAQDRDAFAVSRETAERLRIDTLSDLRLHDDDLVLGGAPECPQRPACLPGLERVYQLRFDAFVPLDVGGPVTTSALVEGVVDVGQVFTTDADVALHDFVVLRDDRGLQPTQNVVPIVRRELTERFPGVRPAADAVSRRLTTDELAQLGEQVEEGADPATVAAEWLGGQGLT